MFKSKAQMKKVFDLHKQGKIGLVQIASMSRGTDLQNLPERVDKAKTVVH